SYTQYFEQTIMSSSAMDQHKISTPGKTSELVEAAIEQSPSRPPAAGGATSSQNETAPSETLVTASMTDRPQN
ncbi:unnamed protein product, partial [Adineta steineri]